MASAVISSPWKMRGLPSRTLVALMKSLGPFGGADGGGLEHLLDDAAQRVEVRRVELVGREEPGDRLGGEDGGARLEEAGGDGGRGRDGAEPVHHRLAEDAVEAGDAQPEGVEPFAGAGVAAEDEAVLEGGGVHGAGGGGGDALDLDRPPPRAGGRGRPR